LKTIFSLAQLSFLSLFENRLLLAVLVSPLPMTVIFLKKFKLLKCNNLQLDNTRAADST
jgi:hypothetical protein